MGRVSKYVSDQVLQPRVDVACGHCRKFGKPVLPYYGYIVDPDKAARPRQAHLDPFVSQLCTTCMNSDNTAKHEHQVEHAGRNLAAYQVPVVSAAKAFHQLPDVLPTGADFVWPFCCDDFCEWLGTARDEEERRAWCQHDAWQSKSNENPAKTGVLHLFRCGSCEKNYTNETQR
ncbi:hypothetical protein [Acanthopleuribacter pedis]|uniref:Uncharacterized protein n=1 Tax=Acanthopleuribacter pedis TaxID=442870 RepID=A0A8J7QFH4_9BACT|nr:hypothetical protein [Acanthopleuribacter pedis]MBO1317485.1 hypothetical protein [Acanthopleuribacter pedis]